MKKTVVSNPRYPHCIRIVRKVAAEWLSENDGDVSEELIYEGCGRSYTDTTTYGNKVVDVNKRKCSIPVRYDEWPAPSDTFGPRVPMSGDMLYVTKGETTEVWEVKDFEPDNNRSVVYGQLNRSIDNDE